MSETFGKHWKATIIVFLGVIFVLASVHILYKFSQPNAFCDGAPYIYATFHDEAPNIYKYSRNGCLLSKNVLSGGPEYALTSHIIELRSIVFGTYNGSEALFVADAFSDDSYLNIYGKCDALGQREFITTAVSTATNPGVNHLYGICFDEDNNLYASSQHTDNVLRFYKDSYDPMPLPSKMIRPPGQRRNFFPGTFIQFGEPMIHEVNEQGVRDVAAVGNTIWVANEDIDSVYVLSASTGKVLAIIDVNTPIGLHYSEDDGLVFVSSKGPKNMGSVYAISVETKEIVQQYKSKKMTHPTGMNTHRSTLYVANQKRGQIVSFNIRSGRFLRVIVDDMPMGIEKILVSDC